MLHFPRARFAAVAAALAMALAFAAGSEDLGCAGGACAGPDPEDEDAMLLQARSVEATAIEPTCSGFPAKFSFTVKGFQASSRRRTYITSGDVKVYACSNDKLHATEGKSGVVLFLHGALETSDSYSGWENGDRPDDYNIIFLTTPRTLRAWMKTDQSDLDHHWMDGQTEDSMTIVTNVVDQVAELYGGYDKVWLAGFSQGAVLSSAVALKGTPQVLGGAFIVAGYPPRPLYTADSGALDMPSSWSSSEKANKANQKIYFYTGAQDTVLPISKSWCPYSQVVHKYGISWGKNLRMWSVAGTCHYDGDDGGKCHNVISPSSTEFEALWLLVQGKVDSVSSLPDVIEAPVSSSCALGASTLGSTSQRQQRQ